MKLGKILKSLALTAAPVVAGSVAGPGVGAAVALALGGGAVGKAGGKKIEQETGVKAQTILAPAGAVGLPALLAPVVDPEFVSQACLWVSKLCENPAALLVLPGLGTILYHTLVSQVSEAAARRPGPGN